MRNDYDENTTEERLSAWLDGELDSAEALEVEALVTSDPRLAKLADSLRPWAAAGAGLAEPPPVSDREWNLRFAAIEEKLGFTAQEAEAQVSHESAGGGFAVVAMIASLAAVLLISLSMGLFKQTPGGIEQRGAAVAETLQSVEVASIEWNEDKVDMVMVEQLDEDCMVLSFSLLN